MKGMKVGPCLELVPGVTWEGAGQFDWLVGESDELAIEELGRTRIFGLQCIVFKCSDGRVRAVHFKALERREEKDHDR